MKNVLGKKKIQFGKRGNVMTPLNWMCGVFETGLLPTAALNSHNWLGIVTFILATLVIIFYGVMYIYFAISDPNRLQTEQYNLESQQMFLDYAGNDTVQIVNDSAKVISSDMD